MTRDDLRGHDVQDMQKDVEGNTRWTQSGFTWLIVALVVLALLVIAWVSLAPLL